MKCVKSPKKHDRSSFFSNFDLMYNGLGYVPGDDVPESNELCATYS